MKGSRDHVIWRCRPVLVSVHAECASERVLIPFRAVALLLQMQQGGGGEDRTEPQTNALFSAEVQIISI